MSHQDNLHQTKRKYSGNISPYSGNTLPEINLFGKYQLGELLGRGAFAKVYRARNLLTGKNFAIKVISKHKAINGGFVSHIKREITIMHRLRHPNIIELVEVLATKTKVYFVMEYAKDGELFTKVSKGRFSEDLSCRYFQQLISAVRYCHSRGVFHRDLKPENLLLDEKLNLKVADFGLSAVKDQIGADGMLHTQCGTPAYVAPEILAKKGYDGAKVDVWSCGVILYVMNAGYLPFNGADMMAMYRKIFKGQFLCPKWISPELRRLLLRLLDPNPKTRITVDEIIRDPWFNKDYKEMKITMNDDHDFDLKTRQGENSSKFLNAFDIISFSSGFDLSCLVNDSQKSVHGERFVSAATPERIIERVMEVAEKNNMEMTRTEWRIRLEGQNGNFVVIVEILRLTEILVVVEVKFREDDVGSYEVVWKDGLMPQLSGLIYKPLEV